MLRRALVSIIAAALFATTAAAAGPMELPTLASDDVAPKPIGANTTYAASSFPLALRITPPDGTWLAGQGKTVTLKRGSFAWAEFMHAPPTVPLGAISMITSLGASPPVATAVSQLRAGAGVTYGPVTPVRLAGFGGEKFDATIGSKHHLFVPLSPPSHAAVYHPDAYLFDAGEVLRIVVLDVRGKTVVFVLENAGLPSDQFPSFLDEAQRLLDTLRFPG
jgi:hypothetical protein